MANEIKRILFVGVSGVGKTTVGASLEKINNKIHCISGSTFKKLLVQPQLKIKGRGSQLTPAQRLRIDAAFFGTIAEHHDSFSHPILIIDTHLALPFENSGYAPVRITSNFSLNSVQGMVLLNATPETVLQRRINRGEETDILEFSIVCSELNAEMKLAQLFSGKFCLPLFIYDTTNTRPEEAAANISHFIENEVVGFTPLMPIPRFDLAWRILQTTRKNFGKMHDNFGKEHPHSHS
ncbi:MAG: AAA family ATPase [Candidatus Micrarchaeota archaeon]